MESYTFKIASFLNADKENVDSPTIIEHGEKADSNYVLLCAAPKTVDGILVPDAPCKAIFLPDDELLKIKVGDAFIAKI